MAIATLQHNGTNHVPKSANWLLHPNIVEGMRSRLERMLRWSAGEQIFQVRSPRNPAKLPLKFKTVPTLPITYLTSSLSFPNVPNDFGKRVQKGARFWGFKDCSFHFQEKDGGIVVRDSATGISILITSSGLKKLARK